MFRAKKTSTAAAKPAAAETTSVPQAGQLKDKIGTYPRDYNVTALPQRRLAAVAQGATVIAVVEAFAIAALAFAIAALIPLQKVVPMVVAGSEKSNEIIRVNPVTLDSPTADYLTELSLRQYVQARYSIVGSNAEQEILWGLNSPVQLMSTQDVYAKFMQTARPDWTRMRETSQTRKVDIASVRKLQDRIWQVEYSTSDSLETTPFNADVTPSSRLWISTFEVDFEPKNVRYEDRLINPLGFTVKQVNDARRD